MWGPGYCCKVQDPLWDSGPSPRPVTTRVWKLLVVHGATGYWLRFGFRLVPVLTHLPPPYLNSEPGSPAPKAVLWLTQ